MNIHKHLLGLIFISLLVVSCTPHYTKNETILHAEALLNSHPDSAYRILSGIQHPEKLTRADYAAWCLHYTHARYKLDMDIKSDSMIRYAMQYYEKTNLLKQSGTAYYLQGCLLQIQQKNKDAMLAYKQANDLLKTTNENDLKGLIDFKIGYLYMLDELCGQSLIHYKKSLKYFNHSGNTKYMAYAYSEISNMYFQLNLAFDSTLYYSNLALKQAKLAGDTLNYYYILSRQGEFLSSRDYAHSAKLLLQGFRFIPARRAEYAAFLSLDYSKLNKPDSANYYLGFARADTTSMNKNLIYLAEAFAAEGNGKHIQAIQYIAKAYDSRDSTFKKDIRNQIYRIDKQYDLTQKEQENAALKIDNRNKVIWIFLLLIAVLVVLISLLLINRQHKKKEVDYEKEKQRLEFELKTKQIENSKKRELLLSKLQNKVENTLQFNSLKIGFSTPEKQAAFLEDIKKQSIISVEEWEYYIDEVNGIFDNKINDLFIINPQLTLPDTKVIVLICIGLDISNSCSLLNMTKNTMYHRRALIKERIGISKEDSLEDWLDENIISVYISK